MRTLRASELGNFLYCQRSWWYQRQGLKSENQLEMGDGIDFHRMHAREVKLTVKYKVVAIVLLLLAVLLALLQVK
ncbi:MAG: hypothetical protein WA110_04760 [Anaerolineaceae bacterium]